MAHEVEQALGRAEDFLERQLRPHRLDARKQRVRDGISEVIRRLRRAVLTFVATLAMLFAYGIFVGLGLGGWLLTVPLAMLLALLALFWPSRRRRVEPPLVPAASASLDQLAARTGEWLDRCCWVLPGSALPAAEAIVDRLDDLGAELARVDPASLPAGDVQRLIGQHLPQLVEAYLALPPRLRGPMSDARRRFVESLSTVRDELDRLAGTIQRDREARFETQWRFIETRYADEKRLGSD